MHPLPMSKCLPFPFLTQPCVGTSNGGGVMVMWDWREVEGMYCQRIH